MAVSDPPHWKDAYARRGFKWDKIVEMIAALNLLEGLDSAPPAHKTSHQNGGGDEISVAALSGLLADPQTPLAHKTSHQNSGTDEISVTDLSGLLADGQTALAHKTSHQPGGGDAMAVDAAAATGSLRTIGSGALQAAAGNHSHAATSLKRIASAHSEGTNGPVFTYSGSLERHLGWYMHADDDDARVLWVFQVPEEAAGTFSVVARHVADTNNRTYSVAWDVGARTVGESVLSNNLRNGYTGADMFNASANIIADTTVYSGTGIAGGDVVAVACTSDDFNLDWCAVDVYIEWSG